MEAFSRIEMLLGTEAIERLQRARVAVFGVGGVGGFAAEALVRSGVGAIDIFDNDTVSVSNLNRQVIALHSTIGQSKVEVMKARLLDINPDVRVTARQMFYVPENADEVDLSVYDYVIDAVDTVAAKIELAVRAEAAGVQCISAMGAGNKLDPTKIEITDIYKTSACPLARVMRRELKSRGVKALKVAYSTEPAMTPLFQPEGESRRATPGSTAFVPSVMGLIIAGQVVRDLAGKSLR
ncbi:MAG: tRNA threonylcarbamoyladenosine dehydratase [Clostridia bacterium]|nr:tRNA threonylcarbamoyladenosine dehydratase [Clostridia bacterium]